jgi:hypothetical protein
VSGEAENGDKSQMIFAIDQFHIVSCHETSISKMFDDLISNNVKCKKYNLRNEIWEEICLGQDQ